MMTKKDYQAIARAIYRLIEDARHGYDATRARRRLEHYAEVRTAIADVLAADNPRFDRERFIEACETGHTKGMPRCRHVACTGHTATGARVVPPVESQRCEAAVLYGDERCIMTREDRDSLCAHHRACPKGMPK